MGVSGSREEGVAAVQAEERRGGERMVLKEITLNVNGRVYPIDVSSSRKSTARGGRGGPSKKNDDPPFVDVEVL